MYMIHYHTNLPLTKQAPDCVSSGSDWILVGIDQQQKPWGHGSPGSGKTSGHSWLQDSGSNIVAKSAKDERG